MLATSLFVGLTIFFYGTGMMRSYGGDIVVVLFLYALVSLIVRSSPHKKALGVFLFACVVELFQLIGIDATTPLGQLTIGSTFDPFDLLAYGIGTYLAVLYDSRHEI